VIRRGLPFGGRAATMLRPLSTVAKVPAFPTIEEAKSMPRHVSSLTNVEVFMLAHEGNHDAIRERLRREIMAVDEIEYVDTTVRLKEMSSSLRARHTLLTAPYHVGIMAAVFAGWASLPLVFHEKTARWFNDKFVTADPPEIGDADTFLEIGSWAWGWMEPPLGTISFFILCVQFAREKRLEVGVKPFTQRIVEYQCNQLASSYPQYDTQVVKAYAESIALHSHGEDLDDEAMRIEKQLKMLKA